ncbi:MAG: hypothetical protein ACRDBY_08685 [Cetobacterium sp.]
MSKEIVQNNQLTTDEIIALVQASRSNRNARKDKFNSEEHTFQEKMDFSKQLLKEMKEELDWFDEHYNSLG